VHLLKRYTNSAGEGVHLDIEDFSGGDDLYGDEVPRLDPPLRIGMDQTDALGGKSAMIIPYNVPDGEHGFDMPGGMLDKARQQCRNQCMTPGDGDPCGCEGLRTFDIGNFMMNMMGRFMASEGQSIPVEECQSHNDCPGTAPLPAPRSGAEIE
jgi:hypothetical protein